MWILWLFLLPVFLVLAVIGGIVGLVFGSFHFWPAFLIIFGLWLLFRGGGRHRHRGWYDDRHARQPAPAPAPAAVRPARPAKQPQLPIDLQVKVDQIRRKTDVLLSYANRFPPFSHELYLVRQTAEDYLPRTINTFLSMPPETVDQPLAGQARTARDELKAQLDLLDTKLDEIAQDLQRQDTDQLISNRRFLEDRFGDASAAS